MGRKGKSGMQGGGGGSTNVREMTSAQINKTITRTAFTVEGNGNWQLDIPGIGGGQILDETGGSRDPANGRAGKLYSVRAWDDEYNMISGSEEYISGSLNDAKQALKHTLRGYYGALG